MSTLDNNTNAWLRYAEEDLRDAAILREDKATPRNGCYLCQQAAEKFFKAVLVATGGEPPRTHDLTRLLFLVAPEIKDDSQSITDAVWLSGFAVQARYPVCAGEPTTDDDVVRALAIATHIRQFCLDRLDH